MQFIYALMRIVRSRIRYEVLLQIQIIESFEVGTLRRFDRTLSSFSTLFYKHYTNVTSEVFFQTSM